MLRRIVGSARFGRLLELLSLRGVVGFHHLLGQLLVRSFRSSYSGALGGWVWVYLKPAIMVTAYYFVFEKILAVRMDALITGTDSYPLFLLSGLIPWMIFADGAMDGVGSLVREADLLKKTRFPLELIPARSVLLAAIRLSPLLLLLWPLGLWLAAGRPVAVLFLLSWLLLQLLFTYYLALVLALLTAALRDIGMLVESVLPLMMFFAPVLYPRESVPAGFAWLLGLNPFTPLADGYHAILLAGSLPRWQDIALLLTWTLLFGGAGYILRRRAREQLVDWL
jgi:ABC-type polysaccharide/polyol phosphate export permease